MKERTQKEVVQSESKLAYLNQESPPTLNHRMKDSGSELGSLSQAIDQLGKTGIISEWQAS